MAEDIVTRLRDRAEERQEALDEYWRGHKFNSDFPLLESQAADEIEDLRAELEECRRQYADIKAERDRWRKIAGQLISGAEHQLDELRFARIPLDNPKWVEAWQAYDEAVHGE